MLSVSVRELKAHLSRFLAEARRGSIIEITSHRKVVARLVGIPEQDDEGIARLLAGSLAEWRGGKPEGARIRLSGDGKPLSDLVVEDRG